MSTPPPALTIPTAVACGLSAGVFFAFSSFVMPAIGRLSPTASIEAMQQVNRLAVTPPFMGVLFGGATLCVAVLVEAARDWHAPGAPWLAAGAAVFLVGCIGVTVVHHVPLNDALEHVDAHGSDAARRWADFASSWNPLNHVRTAAGTAATALMAIGIVSG